MELPYKDHAETMSLPKALRVCHTPTIMNRWAEKYPRREVFGMKPSLSRPNALSEVSARLVFSFPFGMSRFVLTSGAYSRDSSMNRLKESKRFPCRGKRQSQPKDERGYTNEEL